MLSRTLDAYRQSNTVLGPILFDRGIPDILGYAAFFGIELPHCENAAHLYRYNPRVFMAPAWEQIYRTQLDQEDLRRLEGKRESILVEDSK